MSEHPNDESNVTPRWLAFGPVVFLLLVLVGWLVNRSVDAGRTAIDAPGTEYSEVTAVPSSVSCGLSNSLLPIHVVSAGGVNWYGFDEGLVSGQAYEGRLKIVRVEDPSRRVVSGSDLAIFETPGIVAELSPWAPSCE
jgi:hypothetical protein